ncbi:MAG: cobyric acid synthase [Lachnospiraceae bacterium]|nr:cobyric acid synthase [Lachnospiraceae bacterium]
MADYRLKTEGLTIGYDSDLIRDISLKVQPGKIMTLIGPNGSGKTTLLKTVTRQLKIRGGVIYLSETSMDDMSDTEISKQMSMVMTSNLTPEYMTCREVIETGRYPYTGMLGILSDEDKKIADRAVEMTDTSDICDRQFNSISDGQRQRVMLARAICQEPKVLVLDEPTSYLDIRYKLDILSRIKKLAADENIAVVMSIHELEIAMRLSDVVVAIGDGKILRCGSVDEVFKEDFIRDLYGIKDADISLLGVKPWIDKETVISKKPDASVKRKAHSIMIQGTMSGVGKSLIVAGLCRVFTDMGYKAAPFKSQNMALNSYITKDGLEIGRAQAMQAICCGMEPDVCMNPILLKPTGDKTSQVIVNGRVKANMSAKEYFAHKKDLIPDIVAAYEKLSKMVDIIVIEGAGSPAEMNLKSDDIVNMGLADIIDTNVLLVGDIDRGGVFAQLLGTLDLLEPHERERIKGLIVNKFRGDPALFEDGIRILETKGKVKVNGIVPYMDIHVEDEDSLTDRFYVNQRKAIDIAVIRLPHISNFTDFDVFDQFEDVSVRYVEESEDLCKPDMIVLPGTKTTIGDLKWIKEKKLDQAIRKHASMGVPVFGICGGYQMLGRNIDDPDNTEGGGSEEGLLLLPVDTVMGKEKRRTQFNGKVINATGVFNGICECEVTGYEIHMGITKPFDEVSEFTSDSTGHCSGNVYGSYIHGIFDKKEIVSGIVKALADKSERRVETESVIDQSDYRERQYEILADTLKKSLDMDSILKMVGIE